MKKKLIAGVLAASMCLAVTACTNTTEDTTRSETTTNVSRQETQTTVAALETTTEQNTTCSETTAAALETTTEQNTTEQAVEEMTSEDIESVKIGNHLTLRYNAASAEVTWDVQKGVGSRETVVLTAKLKEGYLFDGWSDGEAMVNGSKAVSKELNYTLNVSSKKTVFLNTSMQLVYHENGGSVLKDGVNDTFSAVFHQNPNTRPEKGFFARDGYTLTGYNTKADGSGEAVSLGSKVTGGKGKIDLYCVWEKNTPGSDFETKVGDGGVTITAYNGTEQTVVIPSEINGKAVVGIGQNAFKGKDITRVVVAQSVKKITNNAFVTCKQLETVVLFDTAEDISDGAFNGCNALKNVRINSTTDLINDWFSSAAAKIDRLMWAKDKKKIVIIGGSGSLYGFDCAVMDEALNGEYEIVNFGENANISSLVYFDIVEDFVKEGDIVLWCPEPGNYTLGAPICSSRFWEFRKSNYDFTKYINPQYYDNFYSSLATYSKTLKTRNYKDYDKLSSSMSKYGDDLSSRKWDGKRYDYYFGYPLAGKSEIQEMVSHMTENGVSVYFSFAAMQESGIMTISEKDVLAYERLIESIEGIKSISDYQDCILIDEYFWNSAWHLNNEGARKRTEQVAKDIQNALNNK